MKVEALFNYVNKCIKKGIEPTWEGLREDARTKKHNNKGAYRRIKG